jgi:hypothetical protein
VSAWRKISEADRLIMSAAENLSESLGVFGHAGEHQ